MTGGRRADPTGSCRYMLHGRQAPSCGHEVMSVTCTPSACLEVQPHVRVRRASSFLLFQSDSRTAARRRGRRPSSLRALRLDAMVGIEPTLLADAFPCYGSSRVLMRKASNRTGMQRTCGYIPQMCRDPLHFRSAVFQIFHDNNIMKLANRAPDSVL